MKGGIASVIKRYRTYVYFSICIIVAIYLIQLYSPLRLNTDAAYLLSVAASVADGEGFVTLYGQSSRYPPGYPTMAAGLDLLGLGASWAFIALNCAFLLLGLVASYYIFRRVFEIRHYTALVLCGLTLLSWVVVKYVTLPQTELPYFGVATAGVLGLTYFETAKGVQRVGYFILAALLITAAILIRQIGVALLPAVLWAIFSTSEIKNVKYKRSLVIAGLVLSLPVGVYLLTQVSDLSRLAGWAFNAYKEDFFATFAHSVYTTSVDVGSVFMNVPRSKVPGLLTWIFPVGGIIGAGGLLGGMWLRRREIRAADVYVIFFIGILFVWAGRGARLWLPIIPLVMGWMVVVLQTVLQKEWSRSFLNVALPVYMMWFIATGSMALIYSTRISLADRSEFPDRFGGGSLSPVYRVAFEGLEKADSLEFEENYLAVLARYENRVHPSVKRYEYPPAKRRAP